MFLHVCLYIIIQLIYIIHGAHFVKSDLCKLGKKIEISNMKLILKLGK